MGCIDLSPYCNKVARFRIHSPQAIAINALGGEEQRLTRGGNLAATMTHALGSRLAGAQATRQRHDNEGA